MNDADFLITTAAILVLAGLTFALGYWTCWRGVKRNLEILNCELNKSNNALRESVNQNK